MIAGFRAILVKFSLFALVAALLGYLLVNTMLHGLNGATESYHAEFTDVSGLRVGDDVRVAGVRVGRVQSIAITTSGAEVGFQLLENQQLLTTTKLVMRYQNLLGQRYLSMEQGPVHGAVVQPGSTVPLIRTSPGFDLTELLNGFRPLFQALRPDDVNKLAESVVQVLQGEGPTVESVLAQTTKLTNFLADRDQVVGQVLDNLTPVLVDMAGQGDQLRSSVVELKNLMIGLAQDRKSIGASIDDLSQLVASTSSLLTALRAPAVAAVKRFHAVMTLFLLNRAAFVNALGSFGSALAALGRASSYRNAVNLNFCSILIGYGSAQLNLNGTNNGPFSEVCR